jgi:hypothetical protein
LFFAASNSAGAFSAVLGLSAIRTALSATAISGSTTGREAQADSIKSATGQTPAAINSRGRGTGVWPSFN